MAPPANQDEGPRRFRRLPKTTASGATVPVATGMAARLLGLALLSRSRAGPGLLLPRCARVHTFGMRFALDLHFFDECGVLISVQRAVPPNRLVRERRAASVLELPA